LAANNVILPRLYAIVDTIAYEAHELPPIAAAQTLFNAGVKLLQYRHKGQFTDGRFQEAKQIAEAAQRSGAIFILNDRADYAGVLSCGVHLGQEDLPPEEARQIVGDDAIIGFSTHNRGQLEQAAGLPIDYVALGPVFQTASKHKSDPVIGLEAIPQLRALSSKPLVAIGGITFESALRVLDSGADSVAVISALLPVRRGDFEELGVIAARWVHHLEGRSPAF
jgi:thiamine-phosphate pyrophosphorylase